MGIETAILAGSAIAGVAIGGAGLYKQHEAQKQMERYSGMSSKASIKAEEARRRQMELESFRRRREVVRQGLIAKSRSLSNATSQGAAYSTGLQGGQAQIEGLTNQGLASNEQNLSVGRELFESNVAQFKAQTGYNIASSNADFGKSLFGAGTQLIGSGQSLSRVGASLFSPSGFTG